MGKKRKLVRLRWYNEVHRKPRGRLDDGEENLLVMQMQLYEHKKFSLNEILSIWLCLNARCFDINGRCTSGIPPIVYAAKKGGVFLLWMLLRYGADINAVSTMNESASCAACRHQKFRALKFLTKRGAKLDRIDRSNFSCLRWAVYHGNLKMVQFLLRQPCISVLQDSYTSNSAVEIALSQGYERIVYLLEQKLLYERGNFLKELQFAQAKKDAYVMKKLQRKLAKEEEMLRQKYLQEEEEKIKLKQLYSKYFSSPFFQKTLTRKQKKKVNNTNDSSFVPPEQYALSKMYLQNSMSSIRNALEYQFKAAPGTWVRVNKGKWRYQCDTKENATTAVKINTNSSVAKKGEIINTTNSSEENTVESSIAITCEDTSANNLTSSSTPIVEIQVEAQAQSEETVAVIHKAEALVNPIEMTQVIDISQENIPSPQKRQLNLSPLKRKSPTRKVSKSPIKKPQTSNNLDISPKKIQHLLHNEGKWNTFNQEIDAEVAVAEHPVRRQQDVEVEDLEEYIQ